MPVDELNLCFQAADCLYNQEILDKLNVVSYPNMSKDSQNKLHREVYKRAMPDMFKQKKAVSLSDLSKILKGKV